ncbi:hypothetical protein [Gracilibacillus kekensis]|uniref:Uncharacterized protein n=1 Tax=Gracilibacillus kekensis TaxID=1027249 RepID=A0A1M7QXB6_9BACI|nr:hypothetical protein [Gracilibacillus kekensis]SHN36634.1 hypothetical protein SAMN05216179_3717 [Gracilibacillus kekensis]
MQDEKKYTWQSYTSFGLGVLSTVIVISFIFSLIPRVHTFTVFGLFVVSVFTSVIMGMIVLWRKKEKKTLAAIGITLGLITGVLVLLFIILIWLITPIHPD